MRPPLRGSQARLATTEQSQQAVQLQVLGRITRIPLGRVEATSAARADHNRNASQASE